MTTEPRLSKEEAERKALELQARIREVTQTDNLVVPIQHVGVCQARMKKEKQDEIEKERKRME